LSPLKNPLQHNAAMRLAHNEKRVTGVTRLFLNLFESGSC